MGVHSVQCALSDETVRVLTRRILRDLEGLRRLLESGRFEDGVRRIGAEQELFLVDAAGRPAELAMEVLAGVDDPRFVTELAKYNLEINLAPRHPAGQGFREMEDELTGALAKLGTALRPHAAHPLLAGILPTLRRADLALPSMTPNPRYRALNDEVRRLHGGAFRCHIKGIDEIDISSDSLMLEAANTSFQVHYQVSPAEFPAVYNVAQLVAAPVLAAAVNSPCLLGKRLWSETRVAVFQHSIDARSLGQQARGHRPRVDFGTGWVQRSILELLHEDITRFRIVLAADADDDAVETVTRGGVPELRALRLFNGTVYRWNRPCYGILDGRPHLRIEARQLPSGPTVLDEMANAAFLVGLLAAVPETLGNPAPRLDFDLARANFFAAARYGLDSQFHWPEVGVVAAPTLILDSLLPLARTGLARLEVDDAVAARYLDVIEQRVLTRRTGAAWSLASLTRLGTLGVPVESRPRALVMASLAAAASGRPIHEWDLAEPPETTDVPTEFRTVGQFMTTDLFTVREGDLVDLAAALMDWSHIRHVPVEDDAGRLVGIVSHRAMVRLVARGFAGAPSGPVTVADLMRRDPVVVAPDTRTLDAIRLMREKKIGCLPVVDDDKLVGIVTEHDFIKVAHGLLEERLGTS